MIGFNSFISKDRLAEGVKGEASYGTVDEYAKGTVKPTFDRRATKNTGFVGRVEMSIDGKTKNIEPQRLMDMDGKVYYIVFHNYKGKKIQVTASNPKLVIKKLAQELQKMGAS